MSFIIKFYPLNPSLLKENNNIYKFYKYKTDLRLLCHVHISLFFHSYISFVLINKYSYPCDYFALKPN